MMDLCIVCGLFLGIGHCTEIRVVIFLLLLLIKSFILYTFVEYIYNIKIINIYNLVWHKQAALFSS